MRTARLVGTSPSAIRLARRLRLAVSALALAVIIDLPRAFALDLDGVDGLITETVASRDRQRVWDNSKRYGAESIDERDRTFAKPEGIRAGNARLVGTDGAAILRWIRKLAADPAVYGRMARARNPYGDGRAARRIADRLAMEHV